MNKIEKMVIDQLKRYTHHATDTIEDPDGLIKQDELFNYYRDHYVRIRCMVDLLDRMEEHDERT